MRILYIYLFLLLLCNGCDDSLEGSSEISGTVIDNETGLPISNVEVTLVKRSVGLTRPVVYAPIVSVHTNAAGWFSFDSNEAGKLYLWTKKIGYWGWSPVGKQTAVSDFQSAGNILLIAKFSMVDVMFDSEDDAFDSAWLEYESKGLDDVSGKIDHEPVVQVIKVNANAYFKYGIRRMTAEYDSFDTTTFKDEIDSIYCTHTERSQLIISY